MSPAAKHLLWAACLLAAGCQSSAPSHAVAPVVVQKNDAGAQARPTATPREPDRAGLAVATDPCALRMQDLCGAMLLYFGSNKHLPEKLDALQRYADAGTTLAFTCPASGEPYVYVPAGLTGNGIHDTLILYDRSPVHRGERWGIVTVPPSPGNAPTMYVIPISDKLLRAYGVKE